MKVKQITLGHPLPAFAVMAARARSRGRLREDEGVLPQVLVAVMPGYAFGIPQAGVVPVTAGPGDPGAADAAARGYLRASHADREQVIGVLKAAFVQGRLTKGEFDLRVSQTFASRTYGELVALTADLPAGLAAAQPRQPARARGERPVLRPGRVLTVATTIYAAVWLVAFLLPRNSEGDPQGALQLVAFATLVYLVILATAGGDMLDSWHVKRSGRQLPPRPGQGGRAVGAGSAASPAKT